MFLQIGVPCHRSHTTVAQRLPLELGVRIVRANENIRRLRNTGHTCQDDPYINSIGQLIPLVDDVAMFHYAAEGLLVGGAKTDEIVERNRGNDLGWTYRVTAKTRDR